MATVTCAIVYPIATVSLNLVQKGYRAFALSVILFYFALSTYQVVLGFTVAVIMVQILLMGFRESFSAESIRQCARLLFRYILMLILSVIAYLAITKLLFIYLDMDINPRYQAGFISSIEQLQRQLHIVSRYLLVRIGPIKEFVLPFVGKLGLFVVYVTAMLTVMKRVPKLSMALAVFLWIFLIPLGAISFVLPLFFLLYPGEFAWAW